MPYFICGLKLSIWNNQSCSERWVCIGWKLYRHRNATQYFDLTVLQLRLFCFTGHYPILIFIPTVTRIASSFNDAYKKYTTTWCSWSWKPRDVIVFVFIFTRIDYTMSSKLLFFSSPTICWSGDVKVCVFDIMWCENLYLQSHWGHLTLDEKTSVKTGLLIERSV